MKKIKSIRTTIIFALIFLIFTSNCKNGCNLVTSKVVDKETEIRETDGFKIKITANKVRYTGRNVRGLLRRNLKIRKSKWYGTNYNIQIGKRDVNKKLILRRALKKTDLGKVLEKLSIKFSPNKQHFAISDNGKVNEFLHLLKSGKAFLSHQYYYKKKKIEYTDSVKMNEIDWNTFLNSEQLFDTLIVSKFADNKYLDLLKDMQPGNRYEFTLIDNWDCRIAVSHFTKERVEEIIQASPKWKNKAIEKVIYSIKNNSYSSFKSKTLDLAVYINDKYCLNRVDSIVFYSERRDYSDYGYFTKRLSNNQNPIDDRIASLLINQSKTTLENINERNYKINPKEAVALLLAAKKYNILKQFLLNKIDPKQYKVFRFLDLRGATILMYDKYPADLQKIMVEKYYNYMQNPPEKIDNSNLAYIFEFLTGKIPCKDIKKLYQKLKTKMEPWGKEPEC